MLNKGVDNSSYLLPPIVPITFGDNKARFSYTFFSGGPGRMRVKIHKFLSTEGLVIGNTRKLNEDARTIILNQLKKFKILN